MSRSETALRRSTEREETAPAEVSQLTLAVSGMTCASCAARIEKVLKRQAGVGHASVNFATNTATVGFDPSRTGLTSLSEAVDRIGYHVEPVALGPSHGEADAEERAWLRRLAVAWPLG